MATPRNKKSELQAEEEFDDFEPEEEFEEEEPVPPPRPRRTVKSRAAQDSAAARPPMRRASRVETVRDAPERRSPVRRESNPRESGRREVVRRETGRRETDSREAGRRDARQLPLNFKDKAREAARAKPKAVSRHATRIGGGAILSLLSIGALIVGFQIFMGSRFFALNGVTVEGNTLLSQQEIEALVKSVVPRGVISADLQKVREKLKTNPLIRDAEVARLLPDRLRVQIVEREPVALARRADGHIVCVDAEGMMFGGYETWRGKTMPPTITGLVENDNKPNEINRQWVMTYRQLMADLDQSEPALSSRIDEIHFDRDEGVRLTLADSRILVLIGKEDFRARLNAALDVLDAVRRRDAEALNVLRIGDAERLLSGARIAYLNAMVPKRVVVGLDE